MQCQMVALWFVLLTGLFSCIFSDSDIEFDFVLMISEYNAYVWAAFGTTWKLIQYISLLWLKMCQVCVFHLKLCPSPKLQTPF